MKRFWFGRRGLATGIAAVAPLAMAGGIAYASIPVLDNVYSACMLKGVGTIRLIDKSLPPTNLMYQCTQGAKGDPNGTTRTNGEDDVSVTSASEPADRDPGREHHEYVAIGWWCR